MANVRTKQNQRKGLPNSDNGWPIGAGDVNYQNRDVVIKVRAVANKWLMNNFGAHREYLCHQLPQYRAGEWVVPITTKNINGKTGGKIISVGVLAIGDTGEIIRADDPKAIIKNIDDLLLSRASTHPYGKRIYGSNYRFSNGDGIKAAKRLSDGEIDLLLTDPPYGISAPYGCEKQIPRRLRSDGSDFIMPRGNFGEWDKNIVPKEWLDIVLPKVSGWVVSFCGHAQIDTYQKSLREHKFVAVGTLVWQKTNPVPFNSKHKPVNAWEAVIVGKRPGVIFHGDGVVHNVFKHKSPSPQKRIHPTQKPLGLLRQFVNLFSVEGNTVFDPFAGSGSTIIAAAQANRYGIGYETSKNIYQAACERIKGEIDASLGL
ncbi:MAG: DNA-methyltransferase [Gammaproteobacteria bacterium]